MRIHLVPNSHIDPVWLWDKYEGADEALSTFRSACDRLDEYPALTFSGSSPRLYAWVREYDPALFARIQAHAAAGRWEVAGDWWVEADTNFPSEASLRNQARLARAFARRHFGRVSPVAYLPDTFGHSATLPKILAESGFKYFIFCRPGTHEKADLPSNLFWWEYGRRRVLAYRLKYHYNQYVSEADMEGYLRKCLQDEEYTRLPANGFLFGVGDHGGGPTVFQIELFNKLIAERPAGDMGYSTCERFFAEAERAPGIPVYRGDLHMHAVGCYSVLRPIKEAMRQSERALEHAARARRMAGQPAGGLDSLWKTTLFNQFHDILPGSCAPHAAAQARDELGSVTQSCRELAYGAFRKLSAARPSRVKEGEYRVFNTLPFDVRVPLRIEAFSGYRGNLAFRDDSGAAIPIQKVLESVRCCNSRWEFVDTLPARGFKAYAFDATAPVAPPAPDAGHFRPGSSVSGGGFTLTAAGEALRQGTGPLFQAPPKFLTLADESDTWGHEVRAYGGVTGAFSQASTAVMDGLVTSKLHQRWTFHHSVLDVVWSVYEGLPGIRVSVAFVVSIPRSPGLRGRHPKAGSSSKRIRTGRLKRTGLTVRHSPTARAAPTRISAL
jgi:alpha-mannosidase